jgi:hypothetical protein
MSTYYAVVGLGEASPPQKFLFLPLSVTNVADSGQKEIEMTVSSSANSAITNASVRCAAAVLQYDQDYAATVPRVCRGAAQPRL